MSTQTVELVRPGDIVVEKKSGLSYREFAKQHLFANYPVVPGDACADWPAEEKFTPDFFRTNYGDREVIVEGKPYRLGDYIDLMLVATEANPAPYPCKLQLERDYPELLPNVLPRFRYALPDCTHSRLLPGKLLNSADTLEIFLGSPGGQFSYVHGWWHTVRSLTPTISVASDALNASNWKRYWWEVRTMMDPRKKLKAAAAQAYLATLGAMLSVTERVGLTT